MDDKTDPKPQEGAASLLTREGAALLDLFASYGAKSPEPLPLPAYATLVGVYGVGMLGALRVAGETECTDSAEISVRDFLLLALATHKLSRLVTKDYVTSPFRAPFAVYEESTGAGEVSEKARGSGLRRALGELFT